MRFGRIGNLLEAIALGLVERLWIERADERVLKRLDVLGVERERKIVAGHRGDVVVARLENVRLGLQELHLGVEDIELGSRAGIQTLPGEPERFRGLHDARCLAVDGFLRLLEVGNGLLHIEYDLAHPIVVIVLGLHKLGLGLCHVAVGKPAVPNIPCAGSSKKPTADIARDILRSHVVDEFIAGIRVDAGKPSGNLHLHIGVIDEDRLTLRL